MEPIETKKIKALLGRLQQARCWKDESFANLRTTKWFDLIPYDIDMVKDFLQDYINHVDRR